MRILRIIGAFCVVIFLLLCPVLDGACDMIVLTTGGKQKCVILEETEESLRILTFMGEATIKKSRIKSVKRESDKVNDALQEKWGKKNVRKKPPPPPPEPVQEKPKEPKRIYTIEIVRQAIVIGRTDAGVSPDKYVANITIKDMGVIDGNRLFHVKAMSYRSGNRKLSAIDFYALTPTGVRIDSKALRERKELDLNLSKNRSGEGYVAFRPDADLKTLVVKSDLANFRLDLETGEYNKEGVF